MLSKLALKMADSGGIFVRDSVSVLTGQGR